MKEAIQIFIVDDHPEVRESIRFLIAENENFVVLGEAGNGLEALNKIASLPRLPHIVLMDLDMPLMNGVVCMEKLRESYGNAMNVIAMTNNKGKTYSKRLTEAGAVTLVTKNCDKLELYSAIEKAMKILPERQLPSKSFPARLLPIADHLPFVLSETEKNILKLIAKDHSNQQIAEILSLNAESVAEHKNNLLKKTGSKTESGLVVFAYKNNLITLD